MHIDLDILSASTLSPFALNSLALHRISFITATVSRCALVAIGQRRKKIQLNPVSTLQNGIFLLHLYIECVRECVSVCNTWQALAQRPQHIARQGIA